MLVLRNLPIKFAQKAGSVRGMSVISGPPMVRISFIEKMAHMTVFVVASCAIPTYILCNLKSYQQHGQQSPQEDAK